MHQRVNITLPATTIRLLDRIAKPGNRSRVIAAAVERYAEDLSRAALRRKVKEGAVTRAERDRGLAEAWLALDGGTWPRGR
jgi:CopG family transcriptional regulator/antitoxin EndoAI